MLFFSILFFCRYFRGVHHPNVQLLQKHWGAPHGAGGTGSPDHYHHPDTRYEAANYLQPQRLLKSYFLSSHPVRLKRCLLPRTQIGPTWRITGLWRRFRRAYLTCWGRCACCTIRKTPSTLLVCWAVSLSCGRSATTTQRCSHPGGWTTTNLLRCSVRSGTCSDSTDMRKHKGIVRWAFERASPSHNEYLYLMIRSSILCVTRPRWHLVRSCFHCASLNVCLIFEISDQTSGVLAEINKWEKELKNC